MSKPSPEVDPECPLCGGLGWVRRNVPVGDPDFGKLSPCSCLVPELERQQLERLQSVSGLRPELQDKRFQGFVEIHQNSSPNRRPVSNRAALRAARGFAQEPQGWLIIGGGNGTGKTHLAAAIANCRLARGEPALFVVVPELLDHLRSTYAPHSPVSYDQRFGQICATPLLILDDLGAQQSTEWAWEKLYQILVRRRSQQLPLVVTTNLDVGAGGQSESRKRQPGSVDRRIASRLAEVGWVRRVLITAPDWRRHPGGGKGER
ncbi:MAG: ATP-binding protein [Chloroflexota bacterium]